MHKYHVIMVPKFWGKLARILSFIPYFRDTLFNQKSIGLNVTYNRNFGSSTTRCTAIGIKKVGRPCEACDLMSGEDHMVIGDKKTQCAGGDCKSFNINYGVQCVQCKKAM